MTVSLERKSISILKACWEVFLALLKQEHSAAKGHLRETGKVYGETAQMRAGFAGIIKATTDLQGALSYLLDTLTTEIRNYRWSSGVREEVL